MASVKTANDIKLIKYETQKRIGSRLGYSNYEGADIHMMICGSTGCTSSGSGKLITKLEELIARDEMGEKVAIVKTGCFGLCAEGPIIMVQPGNVMYTQVTTEDLDEIWEEHVKGGKPVERLISQNETEFFAKQERIALRNCGRINPECIDEYIAYDGYEALGKVLNEMDPDDVIDLIKESADSALGLTCPNCAAPISNLGAKHCIYCGSPVIEFNIHAWSFAAIKEL